MAEQKMIHLSVPNMTGNELKYLNEVVGGGWVSNVSPNVAEFEKIIADYAGAERAVATNSGTAAGHLSFLAAGIGPGDEVLCAALTFIAAINPIRFVGAEPVFFGCDEYFCIDPAAVEQFCEEKCEMRDGKLIDKATGAHVKALEVVHVFGNMAQMERLARICEKYHLILIEDATEAVGTYYTEGRFKGKMAGTIGDIGFYSYNGNKTITTGAGGAVLSNRKDWLEKAFYLSTSALNLKEIIENNNFLHDDVGYNYRMNALEAAVGKAQYERLEEFIAHKTRSFGLYQKLLDGKKGLQMLPYTPWARCNPWFFALYLGDGYPLKREELRAYLKQKGVETRAVWVLNHLQKPYKDCQAYGMEKAEEYRERVLNIPCSSDLSDADLEYVARCILEAGA